MNKDWGIYGDSKREQAEGKAYERSLMYRLVVYRNAAPENKVVVVGKVTQAEARKVKKLFSNPKTWNVERRPDLDTFGNIILVVERDDGSQR